MISPLGPGGADPLKNAPAYVDKAQFADALLDITGLSAASATAAAQAPGVQGVAALKSQLDALSSQIANISNPQLKDLLQGTISRSGGDISRVKADLASWFDSGMDRLRRIQATDASDDFRHRPRDRVRHQSGHDTGGHPPMGSTRSRHKLKALQIPSPAPTTADGVYANTEQMIALIDRLAQDGFPVGWTPGHFLDIQDNTGHWEAIWNKPFSVWYRPLLGWFITAIAALFGAPFWFDALQSIIRLKGTGPSPEDKELKRAASS